MTIDSLLVGELLFVLYCMRKGSTRTRTVHGKVHGTRRSVQRKNATWVSDVRAGLTLSLKSNCRLL